MPELDYSFVLLLLIALMAMIYSSVGHGGASGYLAAMALFGLAPAEMKPAALTMNIFVSSLVLFRLVRIDQFDWRLFTPFAMTSIPLAYLGGVMVPGETLYKYFVGITLLIAALRFLLRIEHDGETVSPKLWQALPVGAGLGFLSGLTGVGGGIYLSPLLLLMRWSTMRGSAAIAAAFILTNSMSGLAGHALTSNYWPPGLAYLVIAALLGAVVGSDMVVTRVSPWLLRKILGIVLVIAGIKMLFTAVE